MGLFLWFFCSYNKIVLTIIAMVVALGGALAGCLVGYIPQQPHSGSDPWKWNPEGGAHVLVVEPAYFDWTPAIIVWAVFAAAAVVLLVLAITKKRTGTTRRV